jgi:hypothetical protein
MALTEIRSSVLAIRIMPCYFIRQQLVSMNSGNLIDWFLDFTFNINQIKAFILINKMTQNLSSVSTFEPDCPSSEG